jgi:hypothetical protein
MSSGDKGRGAQALLVGDVIAQGGMGVVREAVQRSLERPVAVKSLPAHGTSDDARRMLLEAWVTGYLEHPGIVPIYDIVGADDGEPIVIMRRIHGKTWLSCLRDPEWAERAGARDLLEQNLRVLVRVCEIVEFAHDRHVVHRDLKPGNVMVGAFGEVYLLDWGLAVATGGEPAAHLPKAEDARDACGTLSYAAPEMVGLIGAPISPQTDVYLLGAVLFDIAAGRPPHRAEDTRDTVASIDSTPPPLPRGVSPQLAAICARALQKMPEDRFASVADLRREILTFLRQRDSEHVVAHAKETLARLVEACAGDGPRQQLYDLYGECRFAFREALRTWPEHASAREGLLSATRTMIEHELAREPKVAAALLAEAPEELPDLAKRVGEALAAEEAQRAALSQVARDHDARIGWGGRRIFLVAMGAVWSLGQIFGDRIAEPSYRRFITGSLIQLPIVALAWLIIPSLRATLFNRRMVGAVVVMLVAQCAMFVGGARLGVDLGLARVAQLGLWAVIAALLTVLLEKKFWPMTAALVVAAVTVAMAPELRAVAATLAIAVVTVSVGTVRADKTDKTDKT